MGEQAPVEQFYHFAFGRTLSRFGRLHLSFIFLFSLEGLLSLWTSTSYDCAIREEMCQHERSAYGGDDFLCTSLFTQRRTALRANKHSTVGKPAARATTATTAKATATSIASIGEFIFILRKLPISFSPLPFPSAAFFPPSAFCRCVCGFACRSSVFLSLYFRNTFAYLLFSRVRRLMEQSRAVGLDRATLYTSGRRPNLRRREKIIYIQIRADCLSLLASTEIEIKRHE